MFFRIMSGVLPLLFITFPFFSPKLLLLVLLASKLGLDFIWLQKERALIFLLIKSVPFTTRVILRIFQASTGIVVERSNIFVRKRLVNL